MCTYIIEACSKKTKNIIMLKQKIINTFYLCFSANWPAEMQYRSLLVKSRRITLILISANFK